MPLLASVAAGSSLRGGASPLPFEQAIEGRQLNICYDPVIDAEGDVCCTAPAIDHSYLTTHGGSEWTGTVQHNSGGTSSAHDNAYFAITWKDGPLTGTTINAWCIDLGRFMGNGDSDFDVYSTYDDWNYNDATDSPERLTMVNWLFNNYKVGGTYDIPGCENNHVIDWRWYQNVIWRLIDMGYHVNCDSNGENCEAVRYSHTGLTATQTCVEDYLVAEAEKNPNYEPGCEDDEVGVLLVVDYVDSSTGEDVISKQVLIGEVNLADHGSNLCKDEVCCEKMIPDHEQLKHNVELEATFAESGAGWAVTFSAGDSPIYSGETFEAWSVDLDRNLADGVAHFVDTYSVYDNWYLTNAVDKKANLPKANYLINEYPVGTSTDCGSDVTDTQFQAAIWILLDDAAAASTDCVVLELVSAANGAPADYESPCDGNIAVLLVVDQDGTQKVKFDQVANRDGAVDENGDAIYIQEVTTELLIAVVPLNDGLCMKEECPCCEPEEEIVLEYCDAYTEIDFTGISTPYITGVSGMYIKGSREGVTEDVPAFVTASDIAVIADEPTPGGFTGPNPNGGELTVILSGVQDSGIKFDLSDISAASFVTTYAADGSIVAQAAPISAASGTQTVRVDITGVEKIVFTLGGTGGIAKMYVCEVDGATPSPNFTGFAPPTEEEILAPTASPVSPTPAPQGVVVSPTDPPVGGGGYGDPHLKTWTGKVYDFHGECDLLLTKSLAFGHGLGFEAQIRTKIVDDWSYISGVAVKIGDDVLEVSSGGDYIYNGVEGADLKKIGANLAGWQIQKHGGKKDNGIVKMRFRVNFEEHGLMDIKVFNEFVSILVHDVQDHEFFDSVGLMGTFQDGLMVGRDRSTVFADANEFGFEWQVRDFDAMLFHDARFPQWPAKCVMPEEVTTSTHRRLGGEANGASAGMIPRAMAEKACEHLPIEDRDACVYDVISTGDVEMASLDSFDE